MAAALCGFGLADPHHGARLPFVASSAVAGADRPLQADRSVTSILERFHGSPGAQANQSRNTTMSCNSDIPR